MDNISRLIKKAAEKEWRLSFRFDPEEEGEQWEAKVYPDSESDCHFYAYHDFLDNACAKILEEIRGFGKW